MECLWKPIHSTHNTHPAIPLSLSCTLPSIDYIHELFKNSSICLLSKLPIQGEIRGQFNHSHVEK